MLRATACALLLLLGPAAGRAHGQDGGPTAARSGEAEHRPGTTLALDLVEGEWLTVGTCGLAGARADGDTTLAVRDPAGAIVGTSDDACGLGSRIAVRAAWSGTYVVSLGCFSGEACGGRVAWVIGDAPAAPPTVEVDAALTLRGIAGPDGQGGIADGALRLRFPPAFGFFVRLSAGPLGVGGGTSGGLFGGTVQLLAGFDVSVVELALGGGIATLSQRPGELVQRETGLMAIAMRLGLAYDFHVAAMLLIPVYDGGLDAGVDGHASLPIGPVEIFLRGIYGFSGVWLGEAGVRIYGDDTRRGIALSVVAGGSALFYQPICRFGLHCDPTVYAGPHVGVGFVVRP